MDYELEKGYFFSDVKKMLEELTGEPVVLETVTKCNGIIMHGFRKTGKREIAEMMKTDREVVDNPVDDIVSEKSVKHGRETFAVAYIDNLFPVFKDGRTSIREVAENNGVTVVENPPLARTLYKLVPIDAIIPAELFAAVAEVLAFVYKKKTGRV